jgi:hypothetical protein
LTVTISFLLFLHSGVAEGQPFAPAAGIQGSSAVYIDSAVFASWAVSCEVFRGPGLLLHPDSVEVTYGQPGDATGKADMSGVVSLGDGGTAILGFEEVIINGPGYDFAVFENSFDGQFLELAYIEVSSDGARYVRFPAFSETGTDHQVGTFGTLDPIDIHNLAGKYQMGYGTPFDLEDLKDSAGLDLNGIRFVKVIDVVGILNDTLGSRDALGRLINDPYPTPFETGGFDLDAVGAMHTIANNPFTANAGLRVYPNPFSESLQLGIRESLNVYYEIISTGSGRVLCSGSIDRNHAEIDLGDLANGIYILKYHVRDNIHFVKIIKQSAH